MWAGPAASSHPGHLPRVEGSAAWNPPGQPLGPAPVFSQSPEPRAQEAVSTHVQVRSTERCMACCGQIQDRAGPDPDRGHSCLSAPSLSASLTGTMGHLPARPEVCCRPQASLLATCRCWPLSCSGQTPGGQAPLPPLGVGKGCGCGRGPWAPNSPAPSPSCFLNVTQMWRAGLDSVS